MLITIVGFIIVLGFLVLVHELGHFLVARAFGIAVEEFGLGFPPKLFAKKYGATVYSINAIPLGGFVKIKGEDGDQAPEADSFGSKPAWQRACVIAAGVSSNVIAGWLLLSILFMAGAPTENGVVRFPPHRAVVAGAMATGNYLNRITLAFSGILQDLWRGEGPGDSLGGPVAIAIATGDALDLGLAHAVIFMAILSFNLAIINILPFPALDGGRLIFLAAEAIRRKPSKQELEAWFHRVGFALLMLLAVVITYRDLARFSGRIWQAVLG